VAKNTSENTRTIVQNENLVEEAFRNYRKNGFPYYAFTSEEKYRRLIKLTNYNHSGVMGDGTIGQTMHGLALAWPYFPHSWSVQCSRMKTPMQVFESDTDFKRAIAKRLKYGSGKLTDAAIRKAVRSFSGAQGVSNFPPSAAASIYHTFLPTQGGTVWDMSSGYGGRLLGALACDHVSNYIGTDPCSETMRGLRTMARELGRDDLDIKLHEVGSEDFVPDRSSLDLCFSSPPYFDTEKYRNEPTQSYLMYPDKVAWLQEFLGTTLDNCRHGHKQTGRLIINNIADVKSYPTLAAEFVAMTCSRGWRLERELCYSLSRMMGTRKPGGDSLKYEPVFVFQEERMTLDRKRPHHGQR
jgi:hypothetical protein